MNRKELDNNMWLFWFQLTCSITCSSLDHDFWDTVYFFPTLTHQKIFFFSWGARKKSHGQAARLAVNSLRKKVANHGRRQETGHFLHHHVIQCARTGFGERTSVFVPPAWQESSSVGTEVEKFVARDQRAQPWSNLRQFVVVGLCVFWFYVFQIMCLQEVQNSHIPQYYSSLSELGMYS